MQAGRAGGGVDRGLGGVGVDGRVWTRCVKEARTSTGLIGGMGAGDFGRRWRCLDGRGLVQEARRRSACSSGEAVRGEGEWEGVGHCREHRGRRVSICCMSGGGRCGV